MKLNRKESIMEEKELEKIKNAIEKVDASDLDNETKKVVLKALKEKAFELQIRLSRIQSDLDEYHK